MVSVLGLDSTKSHLALQQLITGCSKYSTNFTPLIIMSFPAKQAACLLRRYLTQLQWLWQSVSADLCPLLSGQTNWNLWERTGWSVKHVAPANGIVSDVLFDHIQYPVSQKLCLLQAWKLFREKNLSPGIHLHHIEDICCRFACPVRKLGMHNIRFWANMQYANIFYNSFSHLPVPITIFFFHTPKQRLLTLFFIVISI